MLANTEDTQDLSSNEDSYAGLVSMIDLSQGMMVLIIASCPSEIFRDELIERYEKELSGDIPSYRVKLDRSEPSLRAALEKLVTDQPGLKQPKASAVISVTGAESLMSIPVRSEETNSALDRFFGYLQWTREGLREFPFPIVLWVTPNILKQLSAKAPDFWSWRGGVFQFSALPIPVKLFVADVNQVPQTLFEPSVSDLEVEELLVRIEEIEHQDPMSFSLAILFDRLGQAYTNRLIRNNLENKEKAIEYYKKSIFIQTVLNVKSGSIFNTLTRLADLYRSLSRYQEAKELYEKCLRLATKLGHQLLIANIWGCLGYVAFKQGNWGEAKELYQRSLQLYIELGDHSEMAISWGCLGDVARSRGNWDEAEELYQRSLQLHIELGDRSRMADIWGCLGDVARSRGNWDEAEELYQRSLQLHTELGEKSKIAVNWGCVGENELARGNLETAETWLKKALVVMEELQMVDHIAETNWDLAQVYRSQQHHQKAKEHYETAHQLYTQLGATKNLEIIEANWNSA